MNRRDTILALIGFGAGGMAAAQPAKPSRVIATLDDSHESSRAAGWAGFRKRLQELGYSEGKGYRVESRWAAVQASRLPVLAAELVALNPEVIVTVSTPAALAAKKATSRVPIVAIGAFDPVAVGIVASLARPEGNLTGITLDQFDIADKWLELIREIAPNARSIVHLSYRENPGAMLLNRKLEERAQRLGMKVQVHDASSARNVEQAFESMARDRVDALIVAASGAVVNQRRQIVEAAARQRIPAIYGRREYADAGGLMSYAADYDPLFARGADYVHRLLQGTKPSQLPFERASTMKLVLNVKAAKALGLKIPESVRARVDEAIQ